MAFSSRYVGSDKSVPLGKYWRNNPFALSLVPRCQGLYGSAKKIWITSRWANCWYSAVDRASFNSWYCRLTSSGWVCRSWLCAPQARLGERPG